MPQSPIVPSHVLEDRIGCGGVLQGAVGRSRSLRLLFVLGVLGALAAIGVSPAWASPTEPELKAALVFNFAQFVVWPPEARPHPGESLVVGVIGTGELAEALAQGLRDKSLDGAPLSIQRCRDLDDLASCRVLVFDAEPSAWQGVLAQPLPRGLLTVGNGEEFTKAGGIIGMVRIDKHIRFDINLAAAEAAGLTLNPTLLELARSVGRWAPEGRP
ncbi:MAG: YfiR family protein [Candidatus Eisenbacteria bacterium]|uniref:YfiR family protein n=1 Tax=Eiseniibacteriota bacterium TaxID=2212470 RepID=A0A956LWL8_UNCEI|nr:YfiR family protein [Candidatus Eisenbacteria bacterium]